MPDNARIPTDPAAFSALLRADADRAMSGGIGYRRAVPCLPADPSPDHEVAYALHDVREAAARAYAAGATQGEVEATCEAGKQRAGDPHYAR